MQQLYFSRPTGTINLPAKPSVAQRWMTTLMLSGLSLMIRRAVHPEAALARLTYYNRRICGLQTRYQKSGDFLWPYLTGGSGPTVVLLHGFGADKDRFISLVPFLARSYRVVIPDIPGFGDHRENWSLSYDVTTQVERLAIFFKDLGLDRFHLLGVSLGGYMAAFYAARFPEQVHSLALMDSAGFSSPVASDAERLFRSRGRNIFLYTNEAEMIELMDYLFYRPVRLPTAVSRYWTAQGVERLAWRRKLFDDLVAGGMDLLDRLASAILIPTLVIWGARDRICHVSAVDRAVSALPACRACILDRCGHIPMIEYPVLFRKLYLGFLQELYSDGSYHFH